MQQTQNCQMALTASSLQKVSFSNLFPKSNGKCTTIVTIRNCYPRIVKLVIFHYSSR